MANLSFYLLGPTRVKLDEEDIEIKPRKALALLIYLAVTAERHSRDALATLLWPESSQRSARKSLRSRLSELKLALGEEWIDADRESIVLRVGYRLDVAEFQEALVGEAENSQSLMKAAEVYRGDFLTGFTLPDCPGFDEWQFFQSESYRQALAAALERLVGLLSGRGEFQEAIPYARRWLTLDPLHEPAQRELMRLYAQSGQRAAALRQYELVRRILEEELGAEPATQTTTLYEQIQSGLVSQSYHESAANDTLSRPIFFFTDIEKSTQLWDEHRKAMMAALRQHNAILEEQIERYGGRFLESRGDGYAAVFERGQPLMSAIAIQTALGQHDWGEVGELRVRIGLHSVREDWQGYDYFREGDNFHGPALNYSARIMDAAWGGQILVSADVMKALALPAGASWQDFGEHELRGIETPIHIYGLLHPDLPHRLFPPLRTLSTGDMSGRPGRDDRIHHNLPILTTTFVGREAELADIKRLLLDEPGCRLLNLIGPGGFGKTRLALATAAQTVDAFPDGAYFVPLSSVGEAGHIVPAMADALRYTFQGQTDPRDQLLEYLRPKQMLLVMDNFEHLLDGVGLLSEILSNSPGVTFLTTTRQPLNLKEEWSYDIQGLPFPAADELSVEPAKLGGFSAVQLFRQRARQTSADFAPSSEEMISIGRICQLVEGMPLALELAAPWIKVLNCQEIAAEIERSLDFLATSLQNVPERHRSLRVIFEQTWSRLSAAEQAVLRQLSVFRGGCTREAAEQVTGATLPVLSSLMDNALLRRTGGGRYELHGLLRQYGAEKLADAGAELEATRARHAAYFLNFAEQTQPYLEEDSQALWLNLLEREHDNLRTALKWAKTVERAEQGARLAEALSLYWFMRGYLAEGREQLTAFLGLLDDQTQSRQRARLLDRAGFLARYQGDYDSAYALISEGLDICRGLEDDHATADALASLGFIALRQSDLAQARSLYAEALAIHRRLGNGQGMADSLSHLALISSFEGDHDAARRDVEESLATWRDLGDRQGMVWALNILGMVLFRQGNLTIAAQQFKEGFWIAKAIGVKWEIALSLEGLARITAAQNQPESALRLAGRAAALRESVGVPLSTVESTGFERDLAPVYEALGQQAAKAAWMAGQDLDLEELVNRALVLTQDLG